ncbi:MAG: hypothetical protein U0559_18660 [Anaerolineae bacterium]
MSRASIHAATIRSRDWPRHGADDIEKNTPLVVLVVVAISLIATVTVLADLVKVQNTFSG